MKDNEKKEKATEEEGIQLTDEELSSVVAGIKLDPERFRRKVEETYPTE